MRRAFLLAALAACAGDPGSYEPGEELAGGALTVFDRGAMAYSHAAPNLEGERRDPFFVGNSIFNRSWVIAPSSTTGLDGLGPTFNARSCSGCHTRDGRGQVPLLRLGGPATDGSYGGQLQTDAIPGVPVEGRMVVEWTELPGAYADGEAYALRRPTYRIDELAFGPVAGDLMMSPRVAPAVFGLGLLEAIPAEAVRAGADPDDADGDGVSGRANEVADPRGGTALGRFGWKANVPSIEAQSAGAFLGDMGITSSLFPAENCPPAQLECAAAYHDGPDIDDDKLAALVFYARTLAVPGRPAAREPEVLRGKELFHDAGCASCHQPRWETGDSTLVPELSRHAIWPYTDLLLHDLGPDLADGRPDFLAGPSEWRTSPLWGLGALAATSGHTLLLHDGRARGTAEAILWHGGEAAPARDAFRDMPKKDRAALLRFLESL